VHNIPKRRRFVYLMGGKVVKSDEAANHAEVYKYDLDNDVWTQLSNMPYGATQFSTIQIGKDFVYAFHTLAKA
jgi:hypothetical protein